MGGCGIRWWRSLRSLTTGYRNVTPFGGISDDVNALSINGRLRHPVVAFAVLTDHRLSKSNPFRGISDDVNA